MTTVCLAFNSESSVEKGCFAENSVGKRFIGIQLTTICSASCLVGLGLPSCLGETPRGSVVSPSSNSRPELWPLTIMETLGWDISPDPRWSMLTGAGNQLFLQCQHPKPALSRQDIRDHLQNHADLWCTQTVSPLMGLLYMRRASTIPFDWQLPYTWIGNSMQVCV